MKGRSFQPLVIIVLCAAVGSGTMACAKRGTPPSGARSTSVSPEILPRPAIAYAETARGAVSIADVAERAAPSVVNVASSRTVKNARERLPFFFDDPFLRRFFFGPGGGPEPPEERHLERGIGSGVVVSADGIVLTNNHVVEGAEEIKVTAADKREFSAKLVGTDAKSDLAVLRLTGDVKGLTPLKFGESSRLRVGDVVLAIGNPFGVGQTTTMGIVSAKGRANVGIAAYEDFIQTDAAINPGNSGGALVDMEGNLAGINTAILSRTGGNMGIGFAIPANMVQPIMKALLEHGRVVRGWLGVGIQDIDQDLASTLKLPSVRGILISEVTEGSPAARAGLKTGDVVSKLGGQPVDSTGEFRNAIAGAGAGATVKLDLLRDGKPLNVDVKLGELPEKVAAGPGEPSREGGALDGLTLNELDPVARRKFEIPANVKSGVVVAAIDTDSSAATSGIHPGDVIVEVNRKPVATVDEFRRAYAESKGPTLFRIIREGRSLFLVVKR
jgi:serine protease Do